MLSGLTIGLAFEYVNTFTFNQWLYTIPDIGFLQVYELPALAYILGYCVLAAYFWRFFESFYTRYRGWPIPGRALFWAVAFAFCAAVQGPMYKVTFASVYPTNLLEFDGWTRAEAQTIHRHRAWSPRELERAADDPAIQRKLEFLEFGGIWVETGNCLWNGGVRSIEELKEASFDRLTDIVADCRPGPRVFWRRRVRNWKRRPAPSDD